MNPPRPFFLDTARHRLFALYLPPDRGPARDAVLYLPPFAEEMNRSRRMARLAAGRMAAADCGVLLLDPYGSGDSDGEFADATWDDWLDDAGCACDWLAAETGAPVTLWGLRLGAVLAAALAGRDGDVSRLLLWSPVANGRTLLTQFLRIRVAAAMAGGGPAESTDDLRVRLDGGESVEIAGYEISPALASALDDLDLARLAPSHEVAVDWFEVLAAADRPPPPASVRVVEAWRAAGARPEIKVVAGEPFWMLQEITLAPNLIEATARRLEDAR